MNVCITIAKKYDLHADAIIDRLHKKALIIRVDPFEPLPDLIFSSASDEVRLGVNKFNLRNVSGVFCRVALEMLTFDSIVDPVEKFAAREHLSAFIGTLLNVSPKKWINFPWAESTSDGKIYPLMVASKLGIPVPPFLISSLSRDLIEFDLEYGPCVIKPMSDMSIARQNGRFVEVPDLADFSAPYTNNFSVESLVIEEVEERTPTLIQKKIEKLGDVRIVVIDGQMFSSFLKKEDNLVDSRLTKDRDESIYDIQDELRSKIKHLVSDILRLRFAALDFVHGIDDRLYLVDVNPSGNWLWQEQFLGLPISSAISDSLISLPL